MAIALTNFGIVKAGWSVQGRSADASGGETLVAAPGAGKAICIQYLHVLPDDNATLTFTSGTTTIGPCHYLGTYGSMPLIFGGGGLQCPANTALTVTAGGAGQIQIVGWGGIIDV